MLVTFLCLSVFLSPCLASEPSPFVTPEGQQVSRAAAFGTGPHAVLVVKPWDGLTKEVLNLWNTTFPPGRRRLKPLVLFVQAPRATVNRYVSEKSWRFSWLLDEDGAWADEVSPPTLPYLYVFDGRNTEAVFKTSAPQQSLLASLARYPGRTLRQLVREAERGPKQPAPPSSGPWGPPIPTDDAFGRKGITP